MKKINGIRGMAGRRIALAAIMLAIAAVAGSPCSITAWAARAVFEAWTASSPCLWIYPPHWLSAWGWLITRRMFSAFAPGTPSR